jgi:hypothetical protein
MITLILGLLAVLSCIGLSILLHKRARRGGMVLANIAQGAHREGQVTKKTDAAQATRFVFVKKGTDDDHIAVAVATDKPLGIMHRRSAAAEAPVNVKLLGCSNGTAFLSLAGTVAVGDYISPTTGGQGIKLPTASGTYYPCAVALQAGVSGDTIEVMTYIPPATGLVIP